MGPYLKNKAKRGWGSGSSGRAPAKEVWDLSSNASTAKRKERKEKGKKGAREGQEWRKEDD
jgi:hypothetical protein